MLIFNSTEEGNTCEKTTTRITIKLLLNLLLLILLLIIIIFVFDHTEAPKDQFGSIFGKLFLQYIFVCIIADL